jgi:hypothetical protein
MKTRRQDQWLYFVPCVRSLESTFQMIGESTKTGMSIVTIDNGI